MQSRAPGAAGYGDNAEELARRYEQVAFEAVHHDFLPWLPPAPARVVDIGAGSGRDAAALAARGHQVVAVEPTPELRRIGQRLHADAAIGWTDDALPSLTGLRGTFDFVLLSAVWMHLDEQERSDAMRRLARLMAPGGCLALSLRHGPVPAGRRMFAVSAAETVSLADACNSAKSDRLPEPGELHRPAQRNEGIMHSPHPLKKTLQLSLRGSQGHWPYFLRQVQAACG